MAVVMLLVPWDGEEVLGYFVTMEVSCLCVVRCAMRGLMLGRG